MESDGHARSTCGVRELRDAPVRRSVGQRAAAALRPTSIVCWWQLGDAGGAEDRRRAPAPACAGDDGPPRGSVRPTRHSPPHGDIRVVPGWWPLTALGFARAPNRSWRLAALNDQQKRGRVYLYGANSSRARARGAPPPAQLLFSARNCFGWFSAKAKVGQALDKFWLSGRPQCRRRAQLVKFHALRVGAPGENFLAIFRLRANAAARARRWCATAPRFKQLR